MFGMHGRELWDGFTVSMGIEACEARLFTWPQHLYDLEMLAAEFSAWS